VAIDLVVILASCSRSAESRGFANRAPVASSILETCCFSGSHIWFFPRQEIWSGFHAYSKSIRRESLSRISCCSCTSILLPLILLCFPTVFLPYSTSADLDLTLFCIIPFRCMFVLFIAESAFASEKKYGCSNGLLIDRFHTRALEITFIIPDFLSIDGGNNWIIIRSLSLSLFLSPSSVPYLEH
jgi:hypothetical protein